MVDTKVGLFINHGKYKKQIGTKPDVYRKEPADILVYDIGLEGFIGLVYPDGARMIYNKECVGDITYERKRRTVLKTKKKKKRRGRVTLNL